MLIKSLIVSILVEFQFGNGLSENWCIVSWFKQEFNVNSEVALIIIDAKIEIDKNS